MGKPVVTDEAQRIIDAAGRGPCGATLTRVEGGPTVVRQCVMARGHFEDPDTYDVRKWHTDCPESTGRLRSGMHIGDDHDHPEGFTCEAWNDRAVGAIPEFIPVHDAAELKVSADGVLPVYSARLTIDNGDPSHTGDRVFELQVTGTAQVIRDVVEAAVVAFREDAER
jgi:hypothetical protein